MKIQDIFKIDINSKGGGKLFQRIMNRYGIPKKDSVELKDNVNNSSSGGGGKVEYYNIIDKIKFDGFLDFAILQMGCKCIIDGTKTVLSAMYIASEGGSNIISISYYPSHIVLYGTEILLSDNLYNVFYKFLKKLPEEISDEQIREFFDSTLVPITEEEFYNLD